MIQQIEIADPDELYRLIYPPYVKDGHISPKAFFLSGKPDPNVSVNLARLTTVADTLASRAGRGHYLGVLVARYPRRLGLTVEHDPLPNNRSHSLIKGNNSLQISNELAHATQLTGERATLSDQST